MGRRGPEGDVTSSGPGGRNRAAAAAVVRQRRLTELEPRQPPARSGPADSQRDRPKDAGPGRRHRHRLHGRSRPPASGHLVFPRPRPPQVRGRGEGAKPPPPPVGPAAPLWGPGARGPAFRCRARRGRSLVLTAGAGEPSLPACRAAGTGPPDSGSPGLPRPRPGLGGKAGAPRLVARVCSRYRSDPAGARSRTAPAEPAARAGSETPQAPLSVLGPPSGLGELGEWQPLGSARLGAIGPGLGCGAGVLAASSLQLCGETCVSALQPEGPAAPRLAVVPPRSAASARWGSAEAEGDRGTTSFRKDRGSGSVQLVSVPRERPVFPAGGSLGSSSFGARSGRELGPKRACAVGDLRPSLHQQRTPISSLGGHLGDADRALRFGRLSPRVGGGAQREPSGPP